MKKSKWLKRFVQMLTVVFILMNVIAFFHAYKFTHFTNEHIEKTKGPEMLSTTRKVATLVFGVNNPRPKNDKQPSMPFEIVKLKSNKEIECWDIKTENSKGTVVLFHGFSGQKATMLDKAAIFKELGYDTFLVDFMGSGGSEGNQTTIGYMEGEEVKTVFDYLTKRGEKNIYLFGTSMGAVAVMKCMNDHEIHPKGILIECPFGSMYQTVCARFKIMHAPAFPMAGLLVFWGGIQNGFWAFGHNPTAYAKKISCPTLLMQGERDEKVSAEEINQIFYNLKGAKYLKVYKESGHENFLTNNEVEWRKDIEDFLNN